MSGSDASAELEQICAIVAARFKTSRWDSVAEFQNEVSFSSNVLIPALRAATEDFTLHGLVTVGAGSGALPNVQLGLLQFFPDAALIYKRNRFLAFEAKFLDSSGRQQALTQAMGQALIYRAQGYPYVSLALLDRESRLRTKDGEDLAAILSSVGMGLLLLTGKKAPLTILASTAPRRVDTE